MCACEPGFVCAKCQGTPFDDNYVADAELTEREFDDLVAAWEPADQVGEWV